MVGEDEGEVSESMLGCGSWLGLTGLSPVAGPLPPQCCLHEGDRALRQKNVLYVRGDYVWWCWGEVAASEGRERDESEAESFLLRSTLSPPECSLMG